MPRFLPVLLSAACVAGLLGAAPAAANPYAWVSVEATLVYGASGTPVALREAWRFDPSFSAFVGKGVDRNGDRRYAPDELAAAAALNVGALARFGYFTKVTAAGRPVALGRPSGATLGAEGGALTLRFTLPLLRAPATEAEPLTVAVYDPDNFIAFALAPGEHAVRLDGAPAACAVRLVRARRSSPPPAAQAAAVLRRPVELAGTAGEAHADKATVECGSDLLAFAPPAAARFPPALPAASAPPSRHAVEPAARVNEALRVAAAKPLTGAGLLVPPAPAPAPAAAAAPKPPTDEARRSGRSATTEAAAPAPAGDGGRWPVAIIAALGLAAVAAGGLLARGSVLR
jgi:ABC-type uncharacterized transport system substrate-binding protein